MRKLSSFSWWHRKEGEAFPVSHMGKKCYFFSRCHLHRCSGLDYGGHMTRSYQDCHIKQRSRVLHQIEVQLIFLMQDELMWPENINSSKNLNLFYIDKKHQDKQIQQRESEHIFQIKRVSIHFPKHDFKMNYADLCKDSPLMAGNCVLVNLCAFYFL